MDKMRLITLRPGVLANPDDDSFDIKRLQYAQNIPLLTKARMLVRHGKREQAKQIYQKLMKRHESVELHRLLAPLLSAEEMTAMAAKYQSYPIIQQIYLKHHSLRTDGKYSRKSRNRALPWLIAFWLLFALSFLAALAIWNLYVHRLRVNPVNTIEYIHSMPTPVPTKSIQVTGSQVENIVQVVDVARMNPNVRYRLVDGKQVLGYVVKENGSSYVVALLNRNAQPLGTHTANTPSRSDTAGGTRRQMFRLQASRKVSAVQVNVVRTAFMYYLSAHHGNPPPSLASLKPLVPTSIPLSALKYHPSADPLAISNGAQVPYHPVRIDVNLAQHRLTVSVAGKTMMTTRVGVGRSSNQTPTGIFTITRRIVNRGAKAYGPYIFPLNASHYAIHGTSSEKRIGKNESIGCIELPNTMDKRLFDVAPVGTIVSIGANGAHQVPTWFL